MCYHKTDNHDQHSNSSSHSMPHTASTPLTMPINTSITSAANVTKKTELIQHESKPEIEQDNEDDNEEDQNNEVEQESAAPITRVKQKDTEHKDKQLDSELLIEPKNEYDDGNEETVEDLTLDDDELLEDLEQAGPSHGGEGSSQGLFFFLLLINHFENKK